MRGNDDHRLSENRFCLNSAIVGESHDYDWMMAHIQDGEDVTISDVTKNYGLLAVTGPKAREVLSPLTDASLENEDFSWLTGQGDEVAGVPRV